MAARPGTSLTGLFGVGPVVACMLIGYTGDVHRFGTGDHYATYNGTAPIEFPRVGESCTGCHDAAIGS
jgi:transposase